MPDVRDDHSDPTGPSLADRWRNVHATAVAVTPPSGRYVIVAPHPDDEALTVGGLIARLVRAGSDVTVIGVTDGGSAYPGAIDHDELCRIRRAEQRACLDRLGLRDDVVSLGIRDGSVPSREDDLAERLVEECVAGTTLVAPWVHDVHSDHEAVGRAAVRAADATGCTLWSSLFWAWHAESPGALDGVRLARIDLDEHIRTVKAAALRCHVTQLDPWFTTSILDGDDLEPARWDAEYFVTRPSAEVPS